MSKLNWTNRLSHRQQSKDSVTLLPVAQPVIAGNTWCIFYIWLCSGPCTVWWLFFFICGGCGSLHGDPHLSTGTIIQTYACLFLESFMKMLELCYNGWFFSPEFLALMNKQLQDGILGRFLSFLTVDELMVTNEMCQPCFVSSGFPFISSPLTHIDPVQGWTF